MGLNRCLGVNGNLVRFKLGRRISSLSQERTNGEHDVGVAKPGKEDINQGKILSDRPKLIRDNKDVPEGPVVTH
ncbi:hypothetical protein MAM1_0014c01381 [Mucor ambiguus]|uniref:Uncharacterized protein n=1 Tax=Mucor ambiguus TaxID=91626 RepID=A0A0C9M5U5_9FUNG|nr:hypothetical protein MAM1_0014c01381 [Mucor ambiguus]